MEKPRKYYFSLFFSYIYMPYFSNTFRTKTKSLWYNKTLHVHEFSDIYWSITSTASIKQQHHKYKFWGCNFGLNWYKIWNIQIIWILKKCNIFVLLFCTIDILCINSCSVLIGYIFLIKFLHGFINYMQFTVNTLITNYGHIGN